MRRFGLFWLVGLLSMFCCAAVAQQFRISSFTNGEVVIEYPPSFDGAYLFVEQSSNLVSNTVWEAVDYTQVELVLGDTVYYTPPATNAPGSINQTTEVPYEITPEYIQALSSGEIENDSWSVGTVWDATTDGISGFFRILGISFVDTDGDGVDNVSEYGEGTDPYTSDAPLVSLPPDDGDPKPVPGSVDSAPGDWNAPPQTVYKATVGLRGAINARILAMDGTNGTFTADATVAELGAWIESMCGTWQAPAGGDTYPTVDGGRFYRAETNGFTWVGQENIYALAFHPYGGSEQFANHLVRSSAADPAGLAILGGSGVVVNASNPWTEEKIETCLPHLVTVSCRLQRVNGGAFDASDTTAMAQAMEQVNFDALVPVDEIKLANGLVQLFLSFSGFTGWGIADVYGFSRNQQYTFLDNLAARGFGTTVHRGYVGLQTPYDWTVFGSLWDKYKLQNSLPAGLLTNAISKTFTRTDGSNAWLFAEDTNHGIVRNAPTGDYPPYNPPNSATIISGFLTYAGEVLSTFSPPPIANAATLIMDFDRDGTIGTNDLDRTDSTHPFRFWANEDGNAAAYAEADLEDFFPAMPVAPPAMPSNLTFRLSANVGLDYIQTAMTTNDTDAYLTDLTVAGTLSGNIQSLSSGTQTSETFNENDIVLLAASEANINAQIYVHILENGSEIAVSTNHFSFSPVEDMYRIKNFRSGGTSSLDEPANRPDELTNGKDFVFVHGYNVDEAAGHEWNKTIFKRLWFSGSNAKYHAILWDGTPDSLGDKKHYHHSVIHAFATAPDLAIYLNSLNQPVVMAHSLGNMAAGSAIIDHYADVDQYYAMNAAVALEAYGDVAPDANMVPDSLFAVHDDGWFIPGGRKYRWDEYPFETWASEWYRLFSTNDVRSELTWRHRFLDIQNRTDVFNFYSGTEDILRVGDNTTLLDAVDIDIDLWMHFLPVGYGVNTPYVWQIQEQYKGLDQLPWINAPGGGVSKYAGWGFVKGDSQHIEDRFFGLIGHNPVKPPVVKASLDQTNPNRGDYRLSLQSDPLFRHEPEELFQAGALAFAGGTVGTQGGNLEYNTGDNGMDISTVPIRDWLLAKAFPSRTRPMASTAVGDIGGGWKDVNYNMSALYMTNPSVWPNEDQQHNKEWRHSDFRNVPYVHVFKLFDKITTKEN